MWGLHPIRIPLTLVLLTVCCARSVSGIENVWCYLFSNPPPKITCQPGHVIDFDDVFLGDTCGNAGCCPWKPHCRSTDWSRDPALQQYIALLCQGQESCQIMYHPRPILVVCPERDRHHVNYVRVRYTCKALSTPVRTTTTFTTTTDSYRSSSQPEAVEHRSALILLIAVPVVVACLILLTIVLVVVCVKRRKRKQKPAPSPGFTGHRDTATESVYTVSGGDDYQIVQLPLTTIHPELPNPDPGVSAPGPGSSSRDPETSDRKLDRPSEAPDGGASGGQAREPEVYAVVRRDRQEDDELDMKENEAYGHL